VAGLLPPVLRRGRAIGCLLTVSTQRIVAAIAGEVPVLWLITAVSAGPGLWLLRPVGRTVQIIIVVADVAAEIVVELAATRVLIVRRIMRLA
jgi:hypothetical protein